MTSNKARNYVRFQTWLKSSLIVKRISKFLGTMNLWCLIFLLLLQLKILEEYSQAIVRNITALPRCCTVWVVTSWDRGGRRWWCHWTTVHNCLIRHSAWHHFSPGRPLQGIAGTMHRRSNRCCSLWSDTRRAVTGGFIRIPTMGRSIRANWSRCSHNRWRFHTCHSLLCVFFRRWQWIRPSNRIEVGFSFGAMSEMNKM